MSKYVIRGRNTGEYVCTNYYHSPEERRNINNARIFSSISGAKNCRDCSLWTRGRRGFNEVLYEILPITVTITIDG